MIDVLRWWRFSAVGGYEADEYSQVEVAAAAAAAEVCDLLTVIKSRLPAVSVSSLLHHLVTVKGLHCWFQLFTLLQSQWFDNYY